MNEFLPDSTRMLDRKTFEHAGVPVPFTALSDGYRAFIGWLGDLIGHLTEIAPEDPTAVKGVLLVDEIDLHLHPTWQRSILPALARGLRNLQIVATTHSPMVAGTVRSENVTLLVRDGDQIRSRHPEEQIWGLSADQILMSSGFGLSATRDEAFLRKMKTVSKRARAGDREAALQFTRMAAVGAAALDADDE